MTPLDTTALHSLKSDANCHFQRRYATDKLLDLFLKIRKNGDSWDVHARVTFEFGGQEKKHKVCNLTFKVSDGDSKWLGSWKWNFIKPACLNMAGKVSIGEEIQSSPDNITPQELGQLGDQTLLEIWGFDDEFAIKSDFLQEIEESIILEEISSQEVHGTTIEKSKTEEVKKKTLKGVQENLLYDLGWTNTPRTSMTF